MLAHEFGHYHGGDVGARAVDLQDARGNRPHDSDSSNEHVLQKRLRRGTATSSCVSRTLSPVARSSSPTRSRPVRPEPA